MRQLGLFGLLASTFGVEQQLGRSTDLQWSKWNSTVGNLSLSWQPRTDSVHFELEHVGKAWLGFGISTGAQTRTLTR
jgi:hypothetical protein|tara:strand:- start:3236 stop:3466 length:231 start_codon:yes stop_codon:yes gene_type:complete